MTNKLKAAKQYRFSKTLERGFRNTKYIVGITQKAGQRYYVEKLGGKKRLFSINTNRTGYKRYDGLKEVRGL